MKGLKKVLSHLKGDIKGFGEEAKDDKKLIKELKNANNARKANKRSPKDSGKLKPADSKAKAKKTARIKSKRGTKTKG